MRPRGCSWPRARGSPSPAAIKATLEAAAKELGPNAFAIVADATDVAATEAAVRQAVEKFGKLDIVFANAGIPGNTPVGGTTLEPHLNP